MGRIILLNNMRRILLLVWLSMAAFMGAQAQEVVATGICGAEGDGSNLTWTVTDDGVLTISGTGEMRNFGEYADSAPWFFVQDNFNKVVIENGVSNIGSYAFGPSDITSVVLPETLKGIGTHAFSGSNISAINLPEGLDSIGQAAFSDCSKLTSIRLPNCLRTIAASTFDCCGSLSTITLPDSLKSIGAYAFERCSRLTNIVLPQGLREIGYFAFGNCGLASVNIPIGVTTIGEDAFARCSALTSVTIPVTVTTIGDGAFSGCSNLPVIDNIRYADTYLIDVIDRSKSAYSIKQGTRFIGGHAFADCTMMTSLNVPETVEQIGGGAFYRCSSLKTIALNGSINVIPEFAFSGCFSLESIVIPNSVVAIEQSAFNGCSSLKSVVIPESTKVLQREAFRGCGLESVTIEGNVGPGEYYGSYRYYETPFVGCNAMSSIAFVGKCDSIPAFIFYDMPNLASVTFGDKVRVIGEGAFSECMALKSVNLPASVNFVGADAFVSCGLETITINSDFEIGYYYGGNPFAGCFSIKSFSFMGNCTYVPSFCEGLELLTTVTLGDKVNRIPTESFRDCSSLESIIIPNSVNEIGAYAFYNCSALKSINIPEGISKIEIGTFKGCSSLESVEIPQSVTKIGDEVFTGCTSLPVIDNVRYADTYLIGAVDTLKSTYKIKDGTRWIGSEAFYCCTEMKEITIPETVEAIGGQAFMGCASLDFISIPKSVRKIGRRAFGGEAVYIEDDDNYDYDIDDYIYIPCRLKSIVSLNTIPAYYGDREVSEFSDALFDQYTYFHAPLYVPEGSYWDYAYSPGWGEFTQIKEMAMDESALQSRQAYMIADAKGCNYTVYDADKGELVNVEYTHSLDEESEGSCWTVLKDGGKSFLYNIGAKKFASMDKDGKLTLSDAPVNMNIAATENGLSINGRSCMFVLNKNINVDATGIENVLSGTESAEKSEVYTIDGRRMDKAVRGINIVNGNKVLVK